MDDGETTRVGRRAMLAAGLGGLVAAVAAALGMPRRVAAGDGDDLVIGKLANVGQSTTWLHTTNNDGFHSKTDGGDGIVAESSAANKSGLYGFSTHNSGNGVFGRNNTSGSWGALGKADKGAYGMSPSGDGVRGQSGTGDGIVGQSDGAGKSGVYGYNSKGDGYGVFGRNLSGGTSGVLGGQSWGVKGDGGAGEGVRGQSGANNGVVGLGSGKAKSGVYGYTMSADGFGVHGYNAATMTHGYLGGLEHGVHGTSGVQGAAAVTGEHSDPTGSGVSGANSASQTMGALAAGDNAVLGMAPNDLDHGGLFIIGRATFLTRSGLLTIAKNKSSASTPAPLASGQVPSMVLATLQTNRPGVYVQAAVANPATGTVTIYLNKKVTAATKVAFFILN